MLDYQALLNELGLENSEQDLMERNLTPKSDKRLKIVINVNISEKNTQQLKIFEDESTEEAVYNFCNKNQLDENAYRILLQQITMQTDNSYESPQKIISQNKLDSTQEEQDPMYATRPNPSFIDETTSQKELGPKNVYERLHEKAIQKQLQQQEAFLNQMNQKNMTNQEQLKQFQQRYKKLHPGERLYNLCQNKQKDKELQLKKMREEEEKEKMKEFTFKPTINPNTRHILDQMHYEGQYDKKKKNEQSDQKKSQNDPDQQCTFKPQIGEISELLASFMKQTKEHDNVFDQLFYDAQVKKEKSTSGQIIPECTFQPLLNSKNLKSPYSFLERVKIDIDQKKQKIDNLRQEIQTVDFKTGKMLYKPQVGRPPKDQLYSSMNPPSRNIFEQLYSNSYQKENKLKTLQLDFEKEIKANQVRANEKSDDIVFESRKSILRSIFMILDTDQDGLINCHEQEIQNLPTHIRTILWPVLFQISQGGNQFDFEDFFEVAYRFSQTLPQLDKDSLFALSKTGNLKLKQDYYQRDLTFHIALNQREKPEDLFKKE